MVKPTTILAVCVCAHLGAVSLSAAPYRDAARHFTLDLPQGWEALSPEELNQINTAVKQLKAPQPIRYETGFRRSDSDPGSYPFVLLQVQTANTTGASYEELEKALSRDLNAPLKELQGQLTDVVKDMSIGTAVLDRTRNRVLVRMQMNVAGEGPVQGLSVGHLGKDGLVFLHCYATAPEFERWLPTFNQLNDSFRYDAGYTFTPGSGSIWRKIGGGAFNGAIIGGVAGGLAALVAALFRKKAKPKPEPTEPGMGPST
jgi:hypothetical protein